MLYRRKKRALENLPKLFKDANKGERDRQAEHESQVKELYQEVGRLTTQLIWLKYKRVTMKRAERVAMLETHLSELFLRIKLNC
jgi:hypothetical protein